jgi:hypothetical protein
MLIAGAAGDFSRRRQADTFGIDVAIDELVGLPRIHIDLEERTDVGRVVLALKDIGFDPARSSSSLLCLWLLLRFGLLLRRSSRGSLRHHRR